MNNQEIDERVKALQKNFMHIVTTYPFRSERRDLILESGLAFGLIFMAELVKRLPEPKADVEIPEEII